MGDTWPYGGPAYVTWQDCFTQMNSLGRSANDCAIFAAIAQAESSLDYRVVNDTPATGDLSVGLWQINYYGSLYASRAAEFGTPAQLVAGGLYRQALAANAIGQNSFTPWSTFNNGAYLQYLHGGVPPGGGGGSGSPPTIQQGSTGPYVITLQNDLNVLGYGLAVDGDFGPLTRAAVVNFQGRQGIAQDGIVGPITWQHLANAVAAAQGGGSPGPTTLPPAPGAPPPPAEGNIPGNVSQAWANLAQLSGPDTQSQLTYLSGLTDVLKGSIR